MSRTKTEKVKRRPHSGPRANDIATKTFRRKVILLPPDEDGLIAVYAARLPGVASQGRSEEEALRNVTDAFDAAIAVYRECGERVPWQKRTPAPEQGAETRWVRVHG